MDPLSPVFAILLIDDDPTESVTLTRILKALTDAPVAVDYVDKCSEAVRRLNAQPYDLILLDNRLSDRITGEFSVPFIRSAFNKAPLAIISSDVSVPYLGSPNILGVDYVIDKADIIGFIRERLESTIPTDVYPVRGVSRAP